jgi:hypothetical protein
MTACMHLSNRFGLFEEDELVGAEDFAYDWIPFPADQGQGNHLSKILCYQDVLHASMGLARHVPKIEKLNGHMELSLLCVTVTAAVQGHEQCAFNLADVFDDLEQELWWHVPETGHIPILHGKASWFERRNMAMLWPSDVVAVRQEAVFLVGRQRNGIVEPVLIHLPSPSTEFVLEISVMREETVVTLVLLVYDPGDARRQRCLNSCILLLVRFLVYEYSFNCLEYSELVEAPAWLHQKDPCDKLMIGKLGPGSVFLHHADECV